MRELEPTGPGLEQEKTEQIWRDSHMLLTLENKKVSDEWPFDIDAEEVEEEEDENKLPTDIDIDTVFLDYFADKNPSSDKEGLQTREVVLVLPGIGMDLEVNKPFLEALAKSGKRVISLSVPGCGDSGDPSKEWRRVNGKDKKWKGDFSNYSALLNKLLEELRAQGKIGKDEKVRVVGHSLGGAMGAEFAANNLDQVSALDLISPGGHKTEKINPVHVYPATTVDFIHKQGKEVLNRIIENGKEEFPNIIRRMWLNNFAKKDEFNKSDLDEQSVGLFPRLAQRFWEAEVVLRGGLEENIQRVAAQRPVQITVGKDDNLFTPDGYKTILSNVQANGGDINMEVVPDSGHYGPVMNSNKFVDALKEIN